MKHVQINIPTTLHIIIDINIKPHEYGRRAGCAACKMHLISILPVEHRTSTSWTPPKGVKYSQALFEFQYSRSTKCRSED